MDEEVESPIHLREYLTPFRRHWGQVLAVVAVLAAIAIVVALAIPPVYQSSATILVKEQEIPPDLVRSTVRSYADERIQVISQQVMTRAVLLALIDKYALYEKYRKRETTEEILERMRRDIDLSTVDANVSDRNTGRPANSTIAFRISYDAPDPARAQKVVSDLVSLYLEENVKARRQSVAQTSAFLTEEADRLAKQIQQIESNLAAFKRRNAGRLPDSEAVNMQLAERMQSEMLRVDREISMSQDRKLSLEAQLLLIKPNKEAPPSTGPTGGERILAPEDRLRALQAQYASLSARYGADHPDIRRLRREIAALKAEIGASSGDGAAANTSKSLEAELTGQRPDNPAYVVLSSQLESTKRDLSQLARLREELRAKQRTYDARLVQIPEIEREYRNLTRDYDSAQQRYREIRAKQMQAQVAVELEKDSKAERFTLGEPPILPQTPIRPNRPRILLLGLVASLGSGFGLAWLRELLDRSIKGPLELARVSSVPILTPIPYIETERERRRNHQRAWLIACLVILLAAAFIVALHIFLRPLPDLAGGILRRMGIW
jgi:protein tyrosine kinase modulator